MQGKDKYAEVQIRYEQKSGYRHETDDPQEVRKVYDNIHNFIYFPQVVWNFVDTPHFQRLRRIKQLGCLEYVFPGGTHSRFEHSLGTAHLAQVFLRKLIDNNPSHYKGQDQQSALLTITLAGLLHDIGHGPYSHTFDSRIVTKIDKKGDQEPTKWSHELASDILFMHLIEKEGLKKFLKDHEIKRVRALIAGQPDQIRPWEFELISNKKNGIDVDKLDYFRRDAFHLGAKNIFVDHELLMNEARIIDDEICYPTKYVEAVYNIFHCRYKLYKNYYFNLVSQGIELMICDILQEINVKYNFKGICEKMFEDPKDYIKLTDNILEKVEDIYDEMKDREDRDQKLWKHFQRAAGILERIRKRKIYKFVKQFHYFIQDGIDERVLKLFKEQFTKEKIIDAVNKQYPSIMKDRICVAISEIGFGLKQSNPLTKVGFFKKELKEKKPTKLRPQEIPNLTMLFTPNYLERSIKIFIKDEDMKTFSNVEKAFTKYCKNINKKCHDNFEAKGLNIIFEGRGGNTPSVFHNENEASISHRVQNPLNLIEQ